MLWVYDCNLQVIADSQPGANGEQRPFYDYLESCLRHKAEMVIFEAARAICDLKDVTARELTPAITVLQLFLSSSKPVLRFAAVRTLNKVSPSRWGSNVNRVWEQRCWSLCAHDATSAMSALWLCLLLCIREVYWHVCAMAAGCCVY